MTRIKSLIQMLAACDKPDFDKVVRAYLKDVYGFNRIVNTDGKDDTGLDIKIFDLDGTNMQYQLTIQRSDTTKEKTALKAKITEDIIKAQENTSKYGYSNTLYYFYSYTLTNKVQREYKRDAMKTYGINLEIIDSNQIAEESEEFLHLQTTIYDTSQLGEFQLKKSLYENTETKLIYDLISFGSTADIKLSIVEAYVLTILYNRGELVKEEIISMCIAKFQSTESPQFYDKLVNKLYSSTKQLKYDKSTKLYSLSEDSRSKIEHSSAGIAHDEKFFISEIGRILSRYNQVDNIDEYVEQLRMLFSKNFDKRINVEGDCNDLELSSVLNFAKSKDENTAIDIVKDLICVCDGNHYLQSLCASDVFSSRINISYLDKYAQERKCVFIDTTIAIYLLCKFSFDTIMYNRYYYTLSRHLFDFCQKNKIKLNITDRYLWEIGTHVQQAINLISFTRLPNFELLGGSKNVFYNFHRFLVSNCEYDKSFSDYMSEMGFSSNNKTNNEYIELHLNNMGVNVITTPNKYDIEAAERLIETELSLKSRIKTSFALKNDAFMLNYLGDKDPDLHPVDPMFITWDRTLFGVQKKYYKISPNAQRWMQFTPSQFIDRYALLSFSINESTITKEMLAILSDEIIDQTHSLLDSLSLILNSNNEVGLEYMSRFIRMKDSLIYNTDKESDEPQEENVSNILDNVVYGVTQHYKGRGDKLKSIFSNIETIDTIMLLIKEAIEGYQQTNTIDNSLYAKLDAMADTTI